MRLSGRPVPAQRTRPVGAKAGHGLRCGPPDGPLRRGRLSRRCGPAPQRLAGSQRESVPALFAVRQLDQHIAMAGLGRAPAEQILAAQLG
jgi:hypothetical protein